MKSKSQIKYFNWLARFRQETKRFAKQKSPLVSMVTMSAMHDKDCKGRWILQEFLSPGSIRALVQFSCS